MGEGSLTQEDIETLLGVGNCTRIFSITGHSLTLNLWNYESIYQQVSDQSFVFTCDLRITYELEKDLECLHHLWSSLPSGKKQINKLIDILLNKIFSNIKYREET